MPQYRRKPVVVDAIMWDGTDKCLHEVKKEPTISIYEHKGNTLWITTKHRIVRCDQGDWIIKGPTGKFAVKKPDDFEMNYSKNVPLNARHW